MGTAAVRVRRRVPRAYPFSVAGVSLSVERPYAKHPRLTRDGAELGRNRWEMYELVDPTGQVHALDVAFSVARLGPVVRAAGEEVLLVPELPRWVRREVLGCLVAALLVGGLLSIPATLAAAGVVLAVFRSGTEPTRPVVVAAAVLPVAALTGALAAGWWLRSAW